jgi:small multidrug resistance pump
MMHYLFLMVAVAMETMGTTALQASQQFTKLWPTLGAIVAYAGAFYFLGLTLKFMPVGIVYALWSGLGIVFITIIGFVVFGQRLDFAAIAGLTMIIAGIIVIQVFSNTTSH